MGLISKITNSKVRTIGAILSGVIAVAPPVAYNMLNPTAIYAQGSYQTADQLVDQLANLPKQSNYAKRIVAKVLIEAYNVKKIHGETRTENADGSITFKTQGYLGSNQRCVGIQELYDVAKKKFGKKLNTKIQSNIGLDVLVERATDCGYK